MAKDRTAEMRRFMRAADLREEEREFKEGLSDHGKKILKNKKLKVFGEMLT